MQKCAKRFAVISLCLGACASEPSAAPAGTSAAPQGASQPPASAEPVAGQGSATTTPAVQPRTETARPSEPTAPAAGSGATSASAGAPAMASGGEVATTAGAQAPAAGSGAAPVAGSGAEPEQPDDRQPEQTDQAGNCDQDPLTTLRRFAPADEDLAKDFESYLTEEIGTVTCATMGTGAPRMLTQTIYVPPNAIYDGRGETLTADAAAMNCDTSEGEQAESQQPYFLLAPGAQLKNVTITYPGCEGVHMMGDNVLEHVTWPDAGEDAASVRSYFPGGKITIKDSEGHKAADKMFQFNAPCDVRIENFRGSDMGKLVRQNGGTEFELKIDLNKVTVTEVISAVVQSDSPLCFIRHHELSYMFTGSGDKADRVFRDVPAQNVMAY